MYRVEGMHKSLEKDLDCIFNYSLYILNEGLLSVGIEFLRTPWQSISKVTFQSVERHLKTGVKSLNPFAKYEGFYVYFIY